MSLKVKQHLKPYLMAGITEPNQSLRSNIQLDSTWASKRRLLFLWHLLAVVNKPCKLEQKDDMKLVCVFSLSWFQNLDGLMLQTWLSK